MKKNELTPVGGEGSNKAVFVSQDGRIALNVRIEGESVWLTQTAMAELFGCGSDNIVKHLKNIFEEGELQESATTEIFSVVRMEGDRSVTRKLKHYNLDAIIAVGYRVNSRLATQFRIWATKVLKEYRDNLRAEERRASLEELERDIKEMEKGEEETGM